MEERDKGQKERSVCLVSSCLMGLATRYDGTAKFSESCRIALHGMIWIPVCPEQLGGLPTPRTPADLVGGQGNEVLAGTARVISRAGDNVTGRFIQGARQVLAIAESQGITEAFLKGGSPSCGVNGLLGVAAALLKSRGIEVREF